MTEPEFGTRPGVLGQCSLLRRPVPYARPGEKLVIPQQPSGMTEGRVEEAALPASELPPGTPAPLPQAPQGPLGVSLKPQTLPGPAPTPGLAGSSLGHSSWGGLGVGRPGLTAFLVGRPWSPGHLVVHAELSTPPASCTPQDQQVLNCQALGGTPRSPGLCMWGFAACS